jgi:hypothetical protein
MADEDQKKGRDSERIQLTLTGRYVTMLDRIIQTELKGSGRADVAARIIEEWLQEKTVEVISQHLDLLKVNTKLRDALKQSEEDVDAQ